MKWTDEEKGYSLLPSVCLSEQLIPPCLGFLYLTSLSLSKGLVVLTYLLYKDAVRLISQCLQL